MKRLILVAMCAWPVAAGAQDKDLPLQSDMGQSLNQAETVGEAVHCGLRDNVWATMSINILGNQDAQYAVNLWGNTDVAQTKINSISAALQQQEQAGAASTNVSCADVQGNPLLPQMDSSIQDAANALGSMMDQGSQSDQ